MQNKGEATERRNCRFWWAMITISVCWLPLWFRGSMEWSFPCALLVSVGTVHIRMRSLAHFTQAYKHVFMSPSSVDKEPKATCSHNAWIHGMTQVTPPSVAYISTQVWVHIDHHFLVTEHWFQVQFSLMSSPVFSRMDTVMDLEWFYTLLLELFKDLDEKKEVDELLVWWNR